MDFIFVTFSIRWFVWEVSKREKGVLKSACFFTSFLVFLTFLIGILFLEPDLHGFHFLLRFRFDGLFGRFLRGKVCFEKCIFVTSFLLCL
jgi:hypothetical protein